MFFQRSYLFALLIGVFSLGIFAQNDSELREMDSITYSASVNNDEDALDLASDFLKATLSFKPSKYRINAYTILGILNKKRGYYHSSLDYYLKALATARMLKDSYRESACYNNIATVYRLQSNYGKAIEYFEKSLELEKKFGNQLQISIRYFNLGDCYGALDSLDLALSYFNSSLIVEKRLRNREGVIMAEQGIADIYIKSGRIQDAKSILFKTEKLVPALNMELQLIQTKLMSLIYAEDNNLAAAMASLAKGLKIADRGLFRTWKLDLLKCRVAVLKEHHSDPVMLNKAYDDYLKFLDWYEKYNAKNRLDDLSFRDELAQKQLKLEMAQEKRTVAEAKQIKEKQLRLYMQKMIFFVFFLIVFILVLVIYGVHKITKNSDL
jgi:hypothetical protein